MAESVFLKEAISEDDLANLHSALLSDNSVGSMIDTRPQILRRKGSANVKGAVKGFVGKFNSVINAVSPDMPIDEVMRSAVDVMQEWTDIHPSSDANGRLSRILGNAVLHKARQGLIPISLPNKWQHRLVYNNSTDSTKEMKVSYWKNILLPHAKSWTDLATYEIGTAA